MVIDRRTVQEIKAAGERIDYGAAFKEDAERIAHFLAIRIKRGCIRYVGPDTQIRELCKPE